VLALEEVDTQAPVFTAQSDKSYKVGDLVNLALPAAVNPDEELTYFAEDLTGYLSEMGLELNAETGEITGTVTAPFDRDPALYGSWIRVTMTDLAGNESVDEFQISVFDQTNTSASIVTKYFASDTPQVFKYLGASLNSNQTVTLTESYRDVIELAGGNDTVNLNRSDFGMNYSEDDSGRMNFARLDGGDTPGDKIVFKAGTDFDLGLFNRPGDDLQGQVLVNFETFDATAAGVDVNWTITPLDLFLQGSDLLDTSTSGGNRPTLVLIGNAGDTLSLPVVDTDPTDAQDQDFVRIGAPFGWSATGATGTGFTKLQGVVTFGGSVQSVELLVSQAVQISDDINLGRVYPVIG
jgi:hypothetical protein